MSVGADSNRQTERQTYQIKRAHTYKKSAQFQWGTKAMWYGYIY